MFLPKVVLYLLAIVGVFAKFSKLTELIRRVHEQSDSATVYLIGMNEEFVGHFLKTQTDIPSVVISSESSGNFHHNSILVVQAGHKSRQYRDMLHEIMWQMDARKFVIISARSIQNLHQYFLFFAGNKFTWVFGVAEDVPYAYFPYSDKGVQEISPHSPLQHPLKDLNGYVFRTTIKTDIPLTFWHLHKRGHYKVGGSVGKLFINFIKRHNATFREIFIHKYPMLDFLPVINATLSGEIDLSANVLRPYGSHSYPVKLIKYSLMVPFVFGADPIQLILQPFSSKVWIGLGLTMLYIILMDAIKDFCTNVSVNLWNSRSINTHYRFHIPVLFVAFIVINLYLSRFTSYNTISSKGKQYEKIQDVIDNNVPVMIQDFEWDSIHYLNSLAVNVGKVVHIVNRTVYLTELLSMSNTKYAYAVYDQKAKFLINLAQNNLFHLTQDYFHTVYMCFMLPPYSPFKEILDAFVIDAHETGLMTKWDSDAYQQVLLSGVILNHHRKNPTITLAIAVSVEKLSPAWISLGVGWTLAFAVFSMEQAVSRLGRYSRNLLIFKK